MVMCTSKRMFMLCFSSKCKKPKQVFYLMHPMQLIRLADSA